MIQMINSNVLGTPSAIFESDDPSFINSEIIQYFDDGVKFGDTILGAIHETPYAFHREEPSKSRFPRDKHSKSCRFFNGPSYLADRK